MIFICLAETIPSLIGPQKLNKQVNVLIQMRVFKNQSLHSTECSPQISTYKEMYKLGNYKIKTNNARNIDPFI